MSASTTSVLLATRHGPDPKRPKTWAFFEIWHKPILLTPSDPRGEVLSPEPIQPMRRGPDPNRLTRRQFRKLADNRDPVSRPTGSM